MRNWSLIQERYIRDSVPVRLGGLAANLHRIKSFSAQDNSQDAVVSLIEESKFFIEWTACETLPDTAAQLVELQVQLARWQLNWSRIWSSPAQRRKVGEQSLAWSERVMALSDLIKE
jgi:uncharacterized phage protein gp47/JayE